MDTPDLNLDQINAGIADRRDVFYWQTDRAIDPTDAGAVWADRHRYFTDAELLERVNAVIDGDKLDSITPLDPEAQTNLGNVNSVRVGTLTSGAEVIVRCHPKGIKNGYFHAEAAAAHQALLSGIPTYNTLAVHDYEGGEDFAFQVIEKLPGAAVKKWLDENPEDESLLIENAGKMMAQLHKVQVEGFGPFNNELAKSGSLIGLHKTFRDAVMAGLAFNLDVLTKEIIVTNEQAKAITELFTESPLLDTTNAVLVHNDFADWNLLTDGKEITGVLDWDECVGGDPISDLACWSTFFDPNRLTGFLKGYWQIAEKPQDFDEKFELLRLRYTLSKMTLRIRRYSWEPTEAIREKIEIGKVHLAASFKHLGL